MEDSKFNIGDWVIVKLEEVQFVGIITNKTDLGYEVKDNNHYYQFVLEQYLERIDPKTAFLTELSELLDKYHASIYVDFDQSDEIYTTTIAVGEDSVKYSNTYGIDTDNVLNYDK